MNNFAWDGLGIYICFHWLAVWRRSMVFNSWQQERGRPEKGQCLHQGGHWLFHVQLSEQGRFPKPNTCKRVKGAVTSETLRDGGHQPWRVQGNMMQTNHISELGFFGIQDARVTKPPQRGKMAFVCDLQGEWLCMANRVTEKYCTRRQK